jgi:pimeloyl-ACP methyl ester carboxylesterase
VVLIREDEGGRLSLEARWFMYRPGEFAFAVRPGTFHVAAFQAEDGEGGPRKGAAWAFQDMARPIRVSQGDTASGLVVAPSAPPFDEVTGRLQRTVTKVELMSLPRQRRVGEVVPLDDERFSSRTGRMGLWSPGLLLERLGWGIFFLEPYDHNRIPVLLVHGAGGYPQEWDFLTSRMDRARFQPWVFQYPSGMRIQAAVCGLSDMVEELKARYGFRELVVIAHSMGGLVARGAIHRSSGFSWVDDVRLLVTISTPWLGQDAARLGLGHSPYIVPSWIDLAPGSEFLFRMRHAELPSKVSYHLYFGYRGGNSLLAGGSSDGTVSMGSMLDPAAQAEAAGIQGFDEDHERILASEAVAHGLRRLMDGTAKTRQ